MRKLGFAEMNAFVATAERASFAKAAIQLGVSRSTLSETIRGLEEKLGVRLLNRTTRSVALTEVGERLLAELRPALDSFEAAMESVNVFRNKPGGQLRLTVPRPAAKTVIEPILSKFLAAYPAISIEIIIDSGLTDIVRDRFDAGIRPGHRVERDMIAIRVGEDARPTVVASPDYLRRHAHPKAPVELQAHNCIRMRFASGAMQPWVFEKRGKSLWSKAPSSSTMATLRSVPHWTE
jgi:DNA-binding transcriptional LysR family regulator